MILTQRDIVGWQRLADAYGQTVYVFLTLDDRLEAFTNREQGTGELVRVIEPAAPTVVGPSAFDHGQMPRGGSGVS